MMSFQPSQRFSFWVPTTKAWQESHRQRIGFPLLEFLLLWIERRGTFL